MQPDQSSQSHTQADLPRGAAAYVVQTTQTYDNVTETYTSPETGTERKAYHRSREVIGMPVVSIDTGKKLGVVEDLLINPNALRLSGVVVTAGALFTRETRHLTSDQVQVWGEDVILVTESAESASQLRLPASDGALSVQHDLERHSVITTEGAKIGQIEDILLDAHGNVAGYLLSQVYIDGPLKQSRRLSAAATQAMGKDVLIMRAIETL